MLRWTCGISQDISGLFGSLRALRRNTHGIGAMSGLMWCGVHTGDREEAQFWAARKAELRGEDIKEAQQKALNKMNALE